MAFCSNFKIQLRHYLQEQLNDRRDKRTQLGLKYLTTLNRIAAIYSHLKRGQLRITNHNNTTVSYNVLDLLKNYFTEIKVKIVILCKNELYSYLSDKITPRRSSRCQRQFMNPYLQFSKIPSMDQKALASHPEWIALYRSHYQFL